jgi:rhodanese-related sulfurtransferase
VTPEGKEKETVTRLSRVGYDNTLGYLKGGFESWKAAGKEIDILDSITADEFVHKTNAQDMNILDVRKSGEHQSMYLNLKGVENFPLDFINDNLHAIDKNKPYHIHCAGGYRSVIAASILKARGFYNLVNIEGGFDELKKTGIQMSDFVCPSTIK